MEILPAVDRFSSAQIRLDPNNSPGSNDTSSGQDCPCMSKGVVAVPYVWGGLDAAGEGNRGS